MVYERYSAEKRDVLRSVESFCRTHTDSCYVSLLNLSGNGIMGYIDIPKLDISLPVYHGTSSGVLQIAIGHIE